MFVSYDFHLIGKLLMPKIALNGITMNYYDNKNIGQPALVFIHGLGENLESWMYQLQKYNTQYHVVAMDLRGHGQTNGGDSDISLIQFTYDVLALLDTLNIGKAHFIGLSMGGMICQELTRAHQDRMLSMILCNTAAFPTDAGNIPLDTRLDMVKNTPMELMANFVTKSCLPKNYATELYNQTLEMFKQNRYVPYLAATAVAFTADFRDILDQIHVPTLIIVGEFDVVTPVWAAKYLNEHIKGSHLVVIPGSGHLTKLENPILFNHAVSEFLDTL